MTNAVVFVFQSYILCGVIVPIFNIFVTFFIDYRHITFVLDAISPFISKYPYTKKKKKDSRTQENLHA